MVPCSYSSKSAGAESGFPVDFGPLAPDLGRRHPNLFWGWDIDAGFVPGGEADAGCISPEFGVCHPHFVAEFAKSEVAVPPQFPQLALFVSGKFAGFDLLRSQAW